MSKLNGKVAVVTGGNSGIGFAAAKQFKSEGATVFISGRNAERVEKAAAELGVTGVVADVADTGQIENFARIVKEQAGNVDILFVNAGVFYPSPVGQLDESIFDLQMNINFKGAVFTLEKFLPILNEGASVINLSSINAYTGMANTSVYAASKAAMNSFTRTAAQELAAKKIRVNAVNPGPITTPIFSKSGLPEEALNGFAENIQNRVPMKRFGETREVANLVTFLASDEASYMTGGEYNVDGGIAVLT